MPESTEQETGLYDFEHILVRSLEQGDLRSIVKIDQAITGRSRSEYFQAKVRSALKEYGIKISLVAELDGFVVGFVLGQVFFGEFGQLEPVAVVDSIGVHPDSKGQKVAKALMHQMKMNLQGLNIEKLQTHVDWDQFELLNFFRHEGFSPAPRLCLEWSNER